MTRVVPLVSVVMPVYNAVDFVAEAIASIQAQTCPEWELLAVDDGSTDGSSVVVAAIAAVDPRVRLITSVGNQGPGPARNRGIAAARGQYVAFLDADDLWHPEKLKTQLGWMQANAYVLGYTAYVRHDIASGTKVMVGVPARVTRSQLLRTNVIGCSTVIFDAAFFGPRAMSDLKRRQDFAFWLSLLQDTDFAAGLPIALTTYRQRPASVSSSKLSAARSTWAMYRTHLGLSRLATVWLFGNYALRGMLRHKAPGVARRLGLLHDAQLPGV